MDHFDQLRQRLQRYLLVFILAVNVFLAGLYVALDHYTTLKTPLILAACLVAGLIAAFIVARWLSSVALLPIKAIWQAVLHLSPTEQGGPAPDMAKLKIGRELVASLTGQIYQLASVAEKVASEQQRASVDPSHDFVAQNLPLPLVVLDSTQTITFANETAASYIGLAAKDMVGKNVYMVLDMSFPSEDTFDRWLKDTATKSATATFSWERVRLNVRDGHPARLFDLAAYYNRDNPNHQETIMVLFDHTKQYSQDEQAIGFIALSVHELRTPLTLLRGYIEVFEEELAGNITPELQGFMQKMRVMSDQLTAFVNNILNVARIDDDQLELRLQSEDWAATLKSSIEMISLRAKVRGIKLECRISTGLPAVGIDRLSIREVVNNLVDNAIKYSGNSKVIRIETRLNQEGMVETTIQDFGVGIPTSAIPNLFSKFYRDHRNRAQIGGTGLGLYLSKAIVSAHGGSIWVSSQEGQGTTIGFTLLPYNKLAEAQKAGDQGITRSAQGWIKNHSLYRR